jgi:hypothetical protein
MTTTDAIVIRTASRADEPALRRLAALDEAPPLAGPALLAEVDGVARAALGLDDRRAVADPFAQTGALISLLGLRADLLAAGCAPARLARLRAALRRRRAGTVPARA